MISIVGTRLLASLLVLATLIGLQVFIPAVLPLIVAVALIVLPIVQWAAVGFFAARSLEAPTIISLRARVQDALALALAQTVGAALGLIVVLRALSVIQPVDRGVFLVGMSFCLLMIASPAINWLVTWRPWRKGQTPDEPGTEPLALEASVQENIGLTAQGIAEAKTAGDKAERAAVAVNERISDLADIVAGKEDR